MICEMAYEELAAFADGDLDPSRLEEVRSHLAGCGACQERLEALRHADAALAALGRAQPPAAAVLGARRAISDVIRPRPLPEIMTREEVAGFLRITPDQLGEIVEELPAFELAGQVRVRRQSLLEWIQKREREYTRHISDSWVAQSSVIMPP